MKKVFIITVDIDKDEKTGLVSIKCSLGEITQEALSMLMLKELVDHNFKIVSYHEDMIQAMASLKDTQNKVDNVLREMEDEGELTHLSKVKNANNLN